ncbi:MAG: diguanylate cyclase [Solibacillus sp.]
MAPSVYSVQQLNVLFENSRDAVFFMRKFEKDYEYIYINTAAQKLLPQHVIGKTLKHTVSATQFKTISHYYGVAVEKGQQVVFEDYIYAKHAIMKHESTAIPVFDQGENYLLVITREIAFDRELQDKYLFMRSIFFKTFLSTVLISKDAQFLEANPRFIDEFDITMDDVRGQNFFDLPFIDVETQDTVKEYLKQAQTGISTESKVISFVDRFGRKRTFTATFSPLTANQEVVAVFMMMQEITKYLQQRQQLKSAYYGLDMFKKAVGSAADVTFTDLNGRITDMNARFIDRTGYSREELMGKTHSVVNSGYHSKAFFLNLWATLQRGDVWHGEVCNKKKNGEKYWIDSTIIPLTNEAGEVYQYLTVQFNVSDKKEMMIELRNIERTFRAITENTNDFIAVTDIDGMITYASPAFIRKLGYKEHELLDQPYASIIAPESQAVWEALLTQQELEHKVELQLKKATGEIIWTEANYTVAPDFKENTVSEIIIVSREITERKELENELIFMAYHDSLTQLANRRYLEREFPHLIEAANVNFESLALLYIDGDNFKQVNDVYGHDVGDKFLKNFSHALKSSVRPDDLVVRIGGDEFVVVLTNLSRNETELLRAIEQTISNIRQTLKCGWVIQGHTFSPTSSIGISIYPKNGYQLAELIDLADRALYEAKEHSKDNFKISEP